MQLFDPSQVAEVRAEIERQYGPIVAEFEITQKPFGAAPESIRQGWMGVVLPLRSELLEEWGGVQRYVDVQTGEVRENPEAVPVYGFDAVFALDDAGKKDEAAYWHEIGLSYGTFIFRAHEGELRSLVTKE